MTIFACPFRVCGDGTLCDNGKPRRRSGMLAEYECMAWMGSINLCVLCYPETKRVVHID